MAELFENIKKLCLADGTSGDEGDVTKLILSMLPQECDAKIDPLGNIIVNKKGAKTPKNKVMLAAHQDEVGFIVTYITDDGNLKFTTVGGINPEVVIGRQLHFKNGTVGVVGGKAVHQQSPKERDEPVKLDTLTIDIGASSKAEAEKYVSPGDCAYFRSDYTELGNGYLREKALDDRIGCAIMVDILNKNLPYDVTCVFTVQEEIGTRGAKVAAYTVKPDYAIVLETTTACDFSGNDGEKRVCELGKGCVVSYMDRSTIYDRELYRLGFEKAKTLELGIANKINSYHVNGDDVIFTLDTHYDDYMDSYEGKHLPVPHCIENTDGYKLYGSVADCVSGEDIVFRKNTFGSDALYEYLKTACYSSVELVGVVTNICVVANAVLAKTALPDADIIVDSMLTASNDERLHNAALDTMEGMQIIIK